MNPLFISLWYLVVSIVLAILAGYWLKRIVIDNDRRYRERIEAQKNKHVMDRWGRIPRAGDGKALLLFIALVLLICLND